jgi:hypothetical protein
MISLISVGIGYVAGAFTPGILRKIKALFVKESTAAKTAATAAVGTSVSGVVNTVVSKL